LVDTGVLSVVVILEGTSSDGHGLTAIDVTDGWGHGEQESSVVETSGTGHLGVGWGGSVNDDGSVLVEHGHSVPWKRGLHGDGAAGVSWVDSHPDVASDGELDSGGVQDGIVEQRTGDGHGGSTVHRTASGVDSRQDWSVVNGPWVSVSEVVLPAAEVDVNDGVLVDRADWQSARDGRVTDCW